MKNIISFLFFLLWLCPALAQSSFIDELRKLYRVSELPLFDASKMSQVSSFDPTGGNDDGFSGKYSYLRVEKEEFVMAEFKGSGIINRIWTPTPSNDSIRFYFDGEKEARINVPFMELFAGNKFPFVSPLCGSEIGGFYCYLPIPYKKSLKITYKGTGLKFHQIQNKSLNVDSKFESYSSDLFVRNRSVLDTISQVWRGHLKPYELYSKEKVKMKRVSLTMLPGQNKTVFSSKVGGRIIGIELNVGDKLDGLYRDIIFNACWDGGGYSLKLPLADFFGYAYGKPSMQSFLIGSDKNKCYSYLPMPFDSSAEISLDYLLRDACSQDAINVLATVYYIDEPRDKKHEGKFYAQWRRDVKSAKGIPYTVADIQGRGHYLGTVLIAQGLEKGMTLFWEGDDTSVIDGITKMNGTGSEDYFNGGWYAVTDRWDRGISLPVHGSLEYDLKTARTGGYRWFLSDKISFSKSYNLSMEHGPEGNELDVDYTSVAYFYGENPLFVNSDLTVANRTVSQLSDIVLLAQDFTTRLYWSSSMTLEEDGVTFNSYPSNYWATNIDFEAVPIAQISLNGLDFGKYSLSVCYDPLHTDSSFSIWQRTQSIGNWILPKQQKANGMVTVAIGTINITEQLNTITLRRKKEQVTKLKIHSFLLKRID